MLTVAVQVLSGKQITTMHPVKDTTQTGSTLVLMLGGNDLEVPLLSADTVLRAVGLRGGTTVVAMGH